MGTHCAYTPQLSPCPTFALLFQSQGAGGDAAPMSDSETESSTSDHFEDAEESVEAEMPPPPAPPPGAPVVTLASPDIEDHIHMLTGDGVAGRCGGAT